MFQKKFHHYTKAIYVPGITIPPPLERTWSRLCELSNPFFFAWTSVKIHLKIRWNSHLWGIHSCYFCYHSCFPCGTQGICTCTVKHTHTHSFIHTVLCTLPREFYIIPLSLFRFIWLAGSVYLPEHIENVVICDKIYLIWLLIDKYISRPWQLIIIC